MQISLPLAFTIVGVLGTTFAFVFGVIKLRNGKNGSGYSRFVSKDTCGAVHKGLDDKMVMIGKEVEEVKGEVHDIWDKIVKGSS